MNLKTILQLLSGLSNDPMELKNLLYDEGLIPDLDEKWEAIAKSMQDGDQKHDFAIKAICLLLEANQDKPLTEKQQDFLNLELYEEPTLNAAQREILRQAEFKTFREIYGYIKLYGYTKFKEKVGYADTVDIVKVKLASHMLMC